MKFYHSALALSVLALSATTQAMAQDSFESQNQIEVHGDVAKALLSAIEATGAEPSVIPGAYHMNLTNLSCSEGFSLRFPTADCEFTQHITGPRGTNYILLRNYEAHGEQAKGLIRALVDAGVQGKSQVELTHYSVSSIHCVRMVLSPQYPDNTTCTLELYEEQN